MLFPLESGALVCMSQYHQSGVYILTRYRKLGGVDNLGSQGATQGESQP